MKNHIKEILKATLVLSIICFIISAALAGTNQLTAKKIAQLNEEQKFQAMERICEAENYNEQSLSLDGTAYTYYICESNSSAIGYIFTTEKNGYGGPVSVMTGINPEGKIIAVEILSVSDETVGLGQNAAKPDFKNQFSGKSTKLKVSKSAQDDEIQALTGATITSNAVTDAVNTALELYKLAKGE